MLKKLLFLSALLLPSFAIAALSAHGPYIGMQLGYVNPHNRHADDLWIDAILPFISKSGSRAYVGYRINDNFAIEAGYNALVHKTSNSATSNKSSKINGFDLAGKAIVPIQHGLSVYLKGGGAKIHQDISNSSGGVITYSSNTTRVLPLVGVGVGYNINKYFATSLSGTRMFGIGPVKTIDFFTLGISLTFNMHK